MVAQVEKGCLGGVILLSLILGWMTPHLTQSVPIIVGKLYGMTLMPYLWMFIISAFVAEFRDDILPFLKTYWWMFIVLVLLRRNVVYWDIMAHYSIIDTFMLFCGLVGFAYRVPQINITTDISYGIYIYHMTVVNALIALGYVGQIWSFWFVIGLTCLLAWVSTVTIGRLSANIKK